MAAKPSFVPEFDMRIEGAKETGKALIEWSDGVDAKVVATTRNFGIRLRNEVRAGARSVAAVTDYDSSINLHMTGGKDRPRAYVSSTGPQAHRLEHGFIGRDSQGRYVEQAPRPHFRPAMQRMRESYRQAIAETLK